MEKNTRRRLINWRNVVSMFACCIMLATRVFLMPMGSIRIPLSNEGRREGGVSPRLQTSTARQEEPEEDSYVRAGGSGQEPSASYTTTVVEDAEKRNIASRRPQEVNYRHLDLNKVIHSLKIGWKDPPPIWLKELCPQVVEHFIKFPYFADFSPYTQLPIMTTEYAARSVCTMQVAQAVAASVNATLLVHAGSHLGAIKHGGPMPLDDDVDAFLDYNKMNKFMSACGGGHSSGTGSSSTQVLPTVSLHCSKEFNAIKIWLQPIGMKKETPDGFKWWSPFVDLFLYKVNATEAGDFLEEVSPEGIWDVERYSAHDYFPTQSYYFGGMLIEGPPPEIILHRYKLNKVNYKCMLTDKGWNHRLEMFIDSALRGRSLDCERLRQQGLPFVVDGGLISNGDHSLPINATIKVTAI